MSGRVQPCAPCSVMVCVAMLPRCSSSPRPRPQRSRAVFEQRGELSAAIELRRLFPGVTDNAQAR